jgi:hypothetical protein
MGDPVVRPPHLGRDSIVLLGRIVDSQGDGLAQDDIEPYLLVRLLRCGYIRRRQSQASNFIATPAGIERWRLESRAAQRRQDDLDRREIIRGRLQTMIARMELDYPVAPPPPALRDFGLPQIYQWERPALHVPELPAVHAAGLRAARQARRLAGPEPLAVAHDTEPRMTPEAALSLIREGEQRAQRESWLPVTMAGEPMAPERDLPVEHVGRLPAKRDGRAPVVPEANVPVMRDAAVPAIVLAELVKEPPETFVAPDEDQTSDDVSQVALAMPGRNGWRRAALMTGVATVALLAAYPAYRYLSPLLEAPPNMLVASASPPAPAPLPATTAAASTAKPANPSASPVHDVADRAPPATIASSDLAQATVHASAPASVRAPAPAVTQSTPAGTPLATMVAAAAPAATPRAPAAAVATARPPHGGTPDPASGASGFGPGPVQVAAAHEPDRVLTTQTLGADLRPEPEKSAPGTTTNAETDAIRSSAVSAAPAVRPPAEPRRFVATNFASTPVAVMPPATVPPPVVAPTPVAAPPSIVAAAATAAPPVGGASAQPSSAAPVAAAEPVAATAPVPAASPAAVATETPVVAKPQILMAAAADPSPSPVIADPDMAARRVAASPAAAATPSATAPVPPAAAPQPMIATPANAAPRATESAGSGAAPPAAVPAAAKPPPAPAAPQATVAQTSVAATASSSPAMATAPVAASMAAASTAASAAASTAAAPSVPAALPIARVTPAVVPQPVVASPPVEPSSPRESTPKVQVPPPMFAAQEPPLARPEPGRARHRSDHTVVAAAPKDTLVFASANVVEHPLPPVVRRDAQAAPQEEPAESVLARVESAEASDDPMVDRLNIISLQAAKQGKTLSPRALSAGLASLRRTVTTPGPDWSP